MSEDCTPPLDHDAGTIDSSPSPADTSVTNHPQAIGRYRIRRVLGVGGMGTVYLAVQEQPRRTVALKVMKSGMASRSALRRFEYESQILARLHHPNIAQVYDAGTHDTGEGGVPFFAMEYIPNARTITEFANRQKLGTRARLKLFSRVCNAVHHGHQKGIIHRDLKPGNILVESSGEPKIIDFGVARSTDSDMVVTTMQTDIGQLIGTVQYMSPEQCDADPHDLDTRSDVYALGVVLYELLGGQLPYNLHGVALHEAARVIRERHPTRLSVIEHTLKGDIETIVNKALEKDRSRRYQSAGDLEQDINRYLDNEPIDARPPSVVYQVRMFARRHRAAFLALATIISVLALATVVSVAFAVQTARARNRAEAALRDAEQARREAQANLVVAEQREAEAIAARENLRVVSEFQQSMLSEVNAEQMGRAIIDDLRAQIRRDLESDGLPEESVDEAVASFDRLLQRANPTSLALDVIDQQVLARAADATEEEFADQPLVKASLRNAVGVTYTQLGLYAQALTQTRHAMDIRRDILGDEHPDTLDSMSNLGIILTALGRYDQAEPYTRQALDTRRRLLGDDDPATLVSINNLSELLVTQGRFAEAEACHREVLQVRLRTLGEDHPDALSSLNNLGLILQDLQRYDEAETFLREALQRRRQVLGDDDPATLRSMNNLGLLLRVTRRPDEAEPYLRDVLQRRRRVLGDDHPETLNSINNMGFLLHGQRKHAEALPFYRQGLEAKRRVLGSTHPSTLTSLNNLGFLLYQMERPEEAEPLFREALRGRRQSLGANHPGTMSTMYRLAIMLSELERYDEARGLFLECLQACRALAPDGDRRVAGALVSLALTEIHTRYARDAESHAREGIEILQRVTRDGHWHRARANSALGACLVVRGAYVEAELLLLEAARQLEADPSAPNAETRKAIERVVDLYAAWDESEPGLGHDRAAAAWRARLEEPPTETTGSGD